MGRDAKESSLAATGFAASITAPVATTAEKAGILLLTVEGKVVRRACTVSTNVRKLLKRQWSNAVLSHSKNERASSKSCNAGNGSELLEC